MIKPIKQQPVLSR